MRSLYWSKLGDQAHAIDKPGRLSRQVNADITAYLLNRTSERFLASYRAEVFNVFSSIRQTSGQFAVRRSQGQLNNPRLIHMALRLTY
jgi:hypothetical protein